jgi:hypothetical protein
MNCRETIATNSLPCAINEIYHLPPKKGDHTTMAGRKTREESLNAKILKNEEAKAKLLEKIGELDTINNDLKRQLKDLHNGKKKAGKVRAQKAVLKAISDSGLSMEEIRARLGIE